MDQQSEASLQDVSSNVNTSPTAISSASAQSTNQQPTPGGVQQDGDLPPGYPKLAERMAIARETAVFRRFSFLNALNLLYQQAELMDIEEELKDLQRDDRNKSGFEQYYATDAFYFRKGDHPQARLVQEAREKLDRYSMSLLE